MADQTVLQKYGETRNIRYLINSLDDLRDVTDTIIHMAKSNCSDEDFEQVLDNLRFKAVQLGSRDSSFIISLDFPIKFLVAQNSQSEKIRS